MVLSVRAPYLKCGDVFPGFMDSQESRLDILSLLSLSLFLTTLTSILGFPGDSKHNSWIAKEMTPFKSSQINVTLLNHFHRLPILACENLSMIDPSKAFPSQFYLRCFRIRSRLVEVTPILFPVSQGIIRL